MPSKQMAVYKTVPTPIQQFKGAPIPISYPVDCNKCGTHGQFTLKEMLEHEFWCDLAKEKIKKEAAHRLKKKHQMPKRH